MHEIWVNVAHMMQGQKEHISYGYQTFHESSLAQKGSPSTLLLAFQECLSAVINLGSIFCSSFFKVIDFL